jgi:hypothetical protein
MRQHFLFYAISLIATIAVACESERTGVAEATESAAVATAGETLEGAPCCETCKNDCGSTPCRNCKKVDAKQPKYHYSPFYVQLDGGGEFNLITFKDVGLKRADTSINHPLLEVVAESLSYAIGTSDLGYGPAMVGYDESLADPDNHRACGQNHLYVDIWKTKDGGFGYSLWSGCGEEDNFEWRQLEGAPAGDTLADQVEPLTSAIVDSLKKAKASGCFRKNC